MNVVWSPLAVERVGETAAYIARSRPAAAEQWARGIFASVRRLEAFPLSGRRLAESARTDLREIIHGNHRVIYRIEPDRLVVLTVRHVRQHLTGGDPDLG